MGIQETWILGLQTTIVGMSVTFGVLVLLAFIIMGLNRLLDPSFRKKEQPVAQPQEIVTPVAPQVAAVEEVEEVEEGITPSVVAAITVAIAMSLGKSTNDIKFTSIRRASGGEAVWSKMGTADIITTRQRYLDRKGI